MPCIGSADKCGLYPLCQLSRTARRARVRRGASGRGAINLEFASDELPGRDGRSLIFIFAAELTAEAWWTYRPVGRADHISSNRESCDTTGKWRTRSRLGGQAETS